jgi:hypothetical protein
MRYSLLLAAKAEAENLKRIFDHDSLLYHKTPEMVIVLRKMGVLDKFLETVNNLTKEGYLLVWVKDVNNITSAFGINLHSLECYKVLIGQKSCEISILEPKKFFVAGCIIGILSSVIGNYLITTDFDLTIRELLPRVIFSTIGLTSTLMTIFFIFELKEFSTVIRNALTEFSVPFSNNRFCFSF